MGNAIVLAALCAVSPASAEWTAPPNATPQQVLKSAIADSAAGRYEVALAQLIWLHHETSTEEPHFSERLDSALREWGKLARKHPPALRRLRETRDNAETRALTDRAEHLRWFRDAAHINRELAAEDRTVKLFKRLESEIPAAAADVYHVAEACLLEAEEFELCGRYLDPEDAYRWAAKRHQIDQVLANEQADRGVRERLRKKAEVDFLNSAGKIIAILVRNGRLELAQLFAKMASIRSLHPQREDVFRAALQGDVPSMRVE